MEEVPVEDSVSMKMEQDYGNQQILLFYVDEGGGNEQSIITTVEDIQQTLPSDPAQNYYINEPAMEEEEADNNYIVMDASSIIVDNEVYALETWSETEEKRLLVFYIDNKATFLKGVTKENFLWSVACKTMLMGKTPPACKFKLESLRVKYKEILQKHSFHLTADKDVQWPYFALAHQAFHNEIGDPDSFDLDNENTDENPTHVLGTTLYDVGNENILKDEKPIESREMRVRGYNKKYERLDTNGMRIRECNGRNEKLIIRKSTIDVTEFRTKSNNADASVLAMLNLYLQLQNATNLDTKTKWEIIAEKMEENNREYWHKRFHNFRQHYITLLERHRDDHSSVKWPYMEIFNKIFKDDENFQKKYNFKEDSVETSEDQPEKLQKHWIPVVKPTIATWSKPEKVILVKHYFDYYSEHHDPTLPKEFLWSEIGRLLDKDPVDCKVQYEELRADHLDRYIKGGYTTTNRDPLAILYDHIISMDVQNQMGKVHDSAKVTKFFNTNDLVTFFYENIKLFKDEMCYYVCWAAVVCKLNHSLKSCLRNWYALKAVYKTILDQRKNQISEKPWVYVNIFDEIFDFGMNEKMLLDYEKFFEDSKEETGEYETDNTKPGIVNLKLDKNAKVTKILKYYGMHKDKFTKSPHSVMLWKDLSKDIGLTKKQCANELNILKRKYFDILESGIEDESAKQSLWKYYEACKKIFGSNFKMRRYLRKYDENARGLKLCNAEVDDVDLSYGIEEANYEKVRRKKVKWTAKSRELLLTLYLRKLKSNRDNVIDSQKMWKEISIKLNKAPKQCQKMFVKLKRLNQSSNPSFKYKGLIDEILSIKCTFHQPNNVVVSKKRVDYINVDLPSDKLEKVLEYYFKNLDEFVSEKYSKIYSWRQMSVTLNEPVFKLYQKINYLKTNYDKLQDSSHAIILNLILEKEREILKSDLKITLKRGRSKLWSNEEKVKLKELYLGFKDKFSNPKYLKKYLWYEIGLALNRGYKECRKEFLLLKSADEIIACGQSKSTETIIS